jgi:superfamily II DNA or RNA helicase
MERRAYQLSAAHKINALLNASSHPVYLAPCGTGKTYTAASVIADRLRMMRRVYVLVPQVEIFDEWMKVLSEFGLNPGYMTDEGIRGRNRGVYVCMTLSLLNLLPLIPESLYPDEIITDEMQHSLADSWEAIYRFFPQALRLGLTATLYHGSRQSFEHLYTHVVQTISKSRAIAEGFITKPLLIVPEDYHLHIPRSGEDFDTAEQARILGKPRIVGDVIRFYSRTFEGRPVIVPCATYDHADKVCRMFADAGWHFEHLHSALPKHERKRILRAVAAGKNNGICTVGIGIEGMSIHGLYGVLWLRRTLSPIIWTQFNGRAERVLPGKEYYVCADFVGNSVIHGMPDRDNAWSLEGDPEKEQKENADYSIMRECPRCGIMNAAINTVCHFCGWELSDKRTLTEQEKQIPIMVDGKLVAVQSDGQIRDIEDRNESIKETQQLERQKTVAAERLPERSERAAILREGLLSGGRKLFKETVRDWL